MQPGTRVHLYRAGYYNRRGKIVRPHASPGFYLIELDDATLVHCHTSDFEVIPEAKPLDLTAHTDHDR